MLNSFKHRTVSSYRYLILLLVGALTGCDFPGRPNPADRPVHADQIVDFDSLFQKNCAGCHGAEGKLGPAPPLNDPLFLSIVPDTTLRDVITKGRPGTPMAAFAREQGGPLNEAQVKSLATGLKSRWKSAAEVLSPLPTYLAGEHNVSAVSTENLEASAKVFARACAVCHGKQGEGTTKAGAIHDPTFLGLVSDQALRRLIITGRPDLGMPNFADNKARGSDYQPLSSTEINELVTLLGTWRQNAPPHVPSVKSAPASRPSPDNEGQKP